jgi:hypothetical protein
MTARPARGKVLYAPGDFAPVTGIYGAIHSEHRPEHQVIAVRGERFPTCRKCHSAVRFYVVQRVSHMTHDMDLAGPAFTIG